MRIVIKGAVRKMCPYKNEVDLGSVEFTFDITEGDGPELHELAATLAEFPDWSVSHEGFTRSLFDTWSTAGLVRVETTWTTAGLDVTVTAGESDSLLR